MYEKSGLAVQNASMDGVTRQQGTQGMPGGQMTPEQVQLREQKLFKLSQITKTLLQGTRPFSAYPIF